MSLDWENLGFEYHDVNCHIEYKFRDGKWGEGKLVKEPYLNLPLGASALHYGQAAFEGLKAFRGQDDKIRIFRLEENAKRLQSSAERTMMAPVSAEMFSEAVTEVVRQNKDFIPPYASRGALYIRPLLFGSGSMLSVAPAEEYTFIVMVTPVGSYYKGGIKSVDAVVLDGYNRAAPNGVGHVKVAGNYAASMLPGKIAKDKGYPINLYLDAREGRYIDEFGTSNFIALKDNTYITPDSSSILPSITNKSLMTIAADLGMKVERRPVAIEEVDTFEQVAACGTAVVLTPIHKIVTTEKVYIAGDGELSPMLRKLYDQITGIQYGEIADPYGWCVEVK